MKYPLRVVDVTQRYWKTAIADADSRVICQMMGGEWDRPFAEFVVRVANRWHQLRPWFKPYGRENWLWERNTWKT